LRRTPTPQGAANGSTGWSRKYRIFSAVYWTMANICFHSDLDVLATFETSAAVVHGTNAPTRYAVRQVLDQELRRTKALRERSARQARFTAGNTSGAESILFDVDGGVVLPKPSAKVVLPMLDKVKKDFFGRVIQTEEKSTMQDANGNDESGRAAKGKSNGDDEAKIWVTFHEGMNNAVRKPLSLDEMMRGF